MSVAARQVYCFADPVFYETPDRWDPTLSALQVSRRPVPEGWRRRERGFWTHLHPITANLPAQGWKIHVTASTSELDSTCSAVWDYCVRHGLPFKHLATKKTYLAVNSKYAPRSASGKLITIYPSDENSLEKTLIDLEDILSEVRGPAILSDLRWRESPLFVRYGSFIEAYCMDAEGDLVAALANSAGELVPDVRGTSFKVPDWVRLPDFLGASDQAHRATESFPYRVSKALHFSNGGGVYLAERPSDGLQVVLKEARGLAGLDRGNGDAVSRLDREHDALTKLAGIDGIPAWHGYFEAGGHKFLAMEYVEGTNLWVWMAKNHPMILFDTPEPSACAAYAHEALRILAEIEKILERMHAKNIGFGDLHFGNVMVRPDGSVCLIDFEMTYDLTDHDYRPAMGTMGFIAGERASGRQLDDYALAALKCALFFPLEKMRVFDEHKAGEQLSVIAERFDVPTGFLEGIRATLTDRALRPPSPPELGGEPLEVDLDAADWTQQTASMCEAILASADPQRSDRLFPGDSAQFRAGGAINLAHGAGGILWALAVAGRRDARSEEWFVTTAMSTEHQPPGFYNGLHGVAFALDFLGYQDAAAELLDREANAALVKDIGLFKGLSGIGLNLLHFAGRHDDDRLATAAIGIATELASRLAEPRDDRRPAKTGLMHGWSGPALLFTRLYEHTNDDAYLRLATRAVDRDLDGCVFADTGALLVEEKGVRTLAYLDGGSAGIALAIDELSRHVDGGRAAEQLPALLKACTSEFVLQPQLFNGRAGLIAALERNRRRDPGLGFTDLISRHLARQSWHALSYQGHLAFPGEFGLRVSMDLATGVAGVLLATTACTGGTGRFLPFFTDRASNQHYSPQKEV
ncbi:class III lanthionine synthetase LanKC [Amycolatopsis sp. NPDC059657]|uniref:class III lanthionine synthetase LanKC n=1 Tax=Amycolatopsis sp. NPDC059657 TaxID=3346899 RepID=UPI00367354A9